LPELEPGQVVEVEIESFDPLGRGVAWVDDTIVIVPEGRIGRRYHVRITRIREIEGRRIAYAEIVL